jgi:hypothetical protein
LNGMWISLTPENTEYCRRVARRESCLKDPDLKHRA